MLWFVISINWNSVRNLWPISVHVTFRLPTTWDHSPWLLSCPHEGLHSSHCETELWKKKEGSGSCDLFVRKRPVLGFRLVVAREVAVPPITASGPVRTSHLSSTWSGNEGPLKIGPSSSMFNSLIVEPNNSVINFFFQLPYRRDTDRGTIRDPYISTKRSDGIL